MNSADLMTVVSSCEAAIRPKMLEPHPIDRATNAEQQRRNFVFVRFQLVGQNAFAFCNWLALDGVVLLAVRLAEAGEFIVKDKLRDFPAFAQIANVVDLSDGGGE